MRDNVKNSNALFQNMYIQSPHIMPYRIMGSVLLITF